MSSNRDIHAKLDRLLEAQAAHNVLLAEHERRSVALESSQADIRRELKADRDAVAAAIAPLKSHVQAWAGAGKAITTVGALASLGVALWSLASHFF